MLILEYILAILNYRLYIIYVQYIFEVITFWKVPRVICEVSDYLAIEKRLKTHPMQIIYNRLELTSQIIPGKMVIFN